MRICSAGRGRAALPLDFSRLDGPSQQGFLVRRLLQRLGVDEARRQFARFLEECKKYGTAIRIGLNHGSLGAYILEKYGNTPRAMALAAMEWIEMCIDAEMYQVGVAL